MPDRDDSKRAALFSGHPVPDAAKVAVYVTKVNEDALAVCAAFDITDRLADAFGFDLLSPEAFEAGAKYLLKRGYR